MDNQNMNNGYTQGNNQNSNGYTQGYNQNQNGYTQGYNQNQNGYTQGYNQNQNGYTQGYNQNQNGYTQGYNQNPNGYTQGYNQNQNGYAQGYNQNVNGGYNYGNGMYKANPKKRKSTGSVLLGILLGFAVLFFLAVAPLNFGMLRGNDFASIIENSGLSEAVSKMAVEELFARMDIDFDDDVNVEKTTEELSDLLNELIKAAETGKIPSDEKIEAETKMVYGLVCEAYTDYIINKAEEKGGVLKLSDYKNDSEVFQAVYDDLVKKLGDEVKITSANRDEVKKTLEESFKAEDKQIKEFTSDIRKLYEDIIEEDASNSENISFAEMGKVVSKIKSVLSTSVYVALAIIIVIILLQVLLDKNVGMTLKGLFAPLIVPGILTLIGTGLVKAIFNAVLSQPNDLDEVDFEMIKAVSVSFLNPYLIAAGTAIVLAIIFRIVGGIMFKASVANEEIN